MTLLELLQAHARSRSLPMHMPGHKRNTHLAPYLDILGADLDITEIHGFGNLHDPEGILSDRMSQAAALWGSKRAWWLIGGSTAGILAAIDAATHRGDKVLIGRSCHKSVYNACMLCGLETAYMAPDLYENHSFAAPVTPAQVESALAANPDTRLVVLTSPTYEGLMADIPAIADIVHRHGAAGVCLEREGIRAAERHDQRSLPRDAGVGGDAGRDLGAGGEVDVHDLRSARSPLRHLPGEHVRGAVRPHHDT